MKTIHANIITNQKIFEGKISFDQKITKIEKISDCPKKDLDYLLPGFIDLHIHGGGGVDVMDDIDPSAILSTHAKHGTTSVLLTTVTAELSELKKAFQKIAKKKSKKENHEAHILGIHLEGPYINPEKIGAQPNFIRDFSIDEINELNQISSIKIITLAPEKIDSKTISTLVEKKYIVQIGHTNGSYEDGVNAINQGAKSFTHLYNAMSSFHHRAPGITGAALAHATYSEIIPDLEHVHPGGIKMALRAIPKLYFVTDATSATGMPDGDFKLGAHKVSKCQNGVRLKDGTLAGSAITMMDAFKNLVGSKINLSIPEASYRLSTIQSELLGIEKERGSIEVGLFSDLLLISPDLKIKNVFIEGFEI